MGRFLTTHWSIVLATREHDPAARAALARLCQDYRAPVCAYIRHAGHRDRDVEDLAQSFFAKFIEARWHDAADPSLGRFRTFLLVALKRFLANEHDAAIALKRGGAVAFAPLDTALVESLPGEADHTPEEAFDRAYAESLVAQALATLESEARAHGKASLFEALRPHLLEAPEGDDYARLAERLGIRRNTLAVLVKRMRGRLDGLIRARIEQQLESRAAVDAELTRVRETLLSSRRVVP